MRLGASRLSVFPIFSIVYTNVDIYDRFSLHFVTKFIHSQLN